MAWNMTGEEYRGYTIRQVEDTNFVILRGKYIVTRCGSFWSCVQYIDELKQP